MARALADIIGQINAQVPEAVAGGRSRRPARHSPGEAEGGVVMADLVSAAAEDLLEFPPAPSHRPARRPSTSPKRPA